MGRFDVGHLAPNVREAECCMACVHYDDCSCDRLCEIRCKKHEEYFTYPNWVCDDFEKEEQKV